MISQTKPVKKNKFFHLVFQLITPVADSQELLRALLLVLKFFDFYEQAVL